MAHAAEIDNEGVVLRVLVIPDSEEARVQDYLANDLGLGGTWIQTSYNGTIRKNYAGIGSKYDSRLDAFITDSPFPSWVLNEDTCQWEAPTPEPVVEGKLFTWNEETTSWVEIPTNWKEM
jgi:hypothetical protein